MSEPLSPWRWVGRALGTGALLLAIGWLVGGIGAFTSPPIATVIAAIGLFLVGSAWASSRVGGAGLGAGLIAFIAAGMMAFEGHHAFVAATAPIVEQASLSSWDPRGGIIALHVNELRLLRAHEAWATARSGSGKSATSTSQVVTPLWDAVEGRVVGFHCRAQQGDRRSGGGFVLSSAAWADAGEITCAPALALSVAKCREAGVPIAPGSEARFVEPFATEAELRAAHRLPAVAGVPLGLFALYLLLAIVFRERGAASVPE